MGRIIRDFSGNGEARIARPTRRLSESELQAIGSMITENSQDLEGYVDRAIQPGHELTVLAETRKQDQLEIAETLHEIHDRQAVDE